MDYSFNLTDHAKIELIKFHVKRNVEDVNQAVLPCDLVVQCTENRLWYRLLSRSNLSIRFVLTNKNKDILGVGNWVPMNKKQDVISLPNVIFYHGIKFTLNHE